MGGGYSDKQSFKYLKEKVKSFDIEISFNPQMHGTYKNEKKNVLDLTFTIGHEMFIHAANRGTLVQRAWKQGLILLL